MTFSFEALCFLGTLPFPQALCARWGSWVTWLEIGISPQNKNPERVIIIFTRRCGFPLHQKHSFWFYGKLCEFGLKTEILTVPAEDTKQEWHSGISMCVCVYLHLVCSRMLLRSSGQVPNWPHDTVVCMLECDITMKGSWGWKGCWWKTRAFD